jgi:hypothetical protein
MYNENQETTCNKAKIHSTDKNWCNTAPYTGEDGQADGNSIFVLVECGTNKLLPMDQQDELYRYKGVSPGPRGKAKFVRSYTLSGDQ